jgi:hypothetical protein
MPCNVPCPWKSLAFFKTWALLLNVWNGNGHTSLCRSSVGTPCNRCTWVRQVCLIWRHISMISSFLMELRDCHTRTHVSLTAIYYALCCSTCLAVMRSDSLRHKDYHPGVVLMTNSHVWFITAPAIYIYIYIYVWTPFTFARYFYSLCNPVIFYSTYTFILNRKISFEDI